MERLMDVKEVAELLNVSVRLVWQLRDGGRMPMPVHIGRLVRWRREELEGWIAEGAPDLAKRRRLIQRARR
jgi:prophage regulatory protein